MWRAARLALLWLLVQRIWWRRRPVRRLHARRRHMRIPQMLLLLLLLLLSLLVSIHLVSRYRLVLLTRLMRNCHRVMHPPVLMIIGRHIAHRPLIHPQVVSSSRHPSVRRKILPTHRTVNVRHARRIPGVTRVIRIRRILHRK